MIIYLFSVGVSLGSGNPIKSSVIPELYGTERLGGVRSVFTAMMVFGSALGPMV